MCGEGARLVAQLAAFLLATDGQAGGQVLDAHRRLDLVEVRVRLRVGVRLGLRVRVGVGVRVRVRGWG